MPMDNFKIINDELLKDNPYSKVKSQTSDYIILRIKTKNLLRGVGDFTYFVLLYKKYIASIKDDRYPRDTLLKAIRIEIKDNLSKFTILIAENGNDKQFLIDLLSKHYDLRQFPVFSADELINPEEIISKTILNLLLNYPYANFFNRLFPYSIDSIPRGKMFYGRKDIMQKMIDANNNVVLIGARRIGKTSLAYNLSDVLGTIPSTGIKITSNKIKKCAVIDVSNLSEYDNDIWEKILNSFNYDPSLYLPYARKKRGTQLFKDYVRSVEKLLESYNGELVIILDEVDNWILQDSLNGWKILNPLRSMTDQGKAKIILIGYETLQSTIRKHDFPLSGRFEVRKLKPLTRDEMIALVKEPLNELRVTINPSFESEFIEELWGLSGGRPNLVQGFCLELLNLVSEKELKIINKTYFSIAKNTSLIYKSYLEDIVHGGNPFARLICGVAAHIKSKNNKNSNSIRLKEIIDEIENLGHKYNSTEYDINLLQLDLRHIITPSNKAEGLYKFTSQLICDEFLTEINKVGYKHWTEDLLRIHNKTQS